MTKTIPNYLRIHRGPGAAAPSPLESTEDTVERFWEAYRQATGWRLKPSATSDALPSELLPAIVIDPMDGPETDPPPAVGRQNAAALAAAATDLAGQLQQARATVRSQEIELAARASILNEDEGRQRVAEQIESTLADAAVACGCDAAVMYLLDDDTQNLKARAVFGLSPQRLEQPPRPLRGSRGDLEALVQGVVAVDDFHVDLIDTWNSPEPFAGGICAAVLQHDIPIGTLWLFAAEAKAFGESEAAAARIAAGQLGMILSQAAVGRRSGQQRREQEVIRDFGVWQYQGLPVGERLAESWLVDGMIESPRAWAIGWHAWDVLPDGSLLLAMAEACDETVIGALSAATARAALAAHSGYRHTPRQLLHRIHDTLWQTSTGQQLVSLLYARIDPESGEGEVATAGNITALIANRYGYRPIVDGHSPPLTSHIDARCVAESFRLGNGETLLAYGPGVIADGASQRLLGECVRESMGLAESSPLARIRRELAAHPLQHERGLVALTNATTQRH